jgi:hypothetical protein
MKTKILLLCGLLLTSISCKKDKSSVDLQKGLVSYFNFDDNLIDQKGYASNGVSTGNPTFTAGKIGKALTLNGTNQYVDFIANPSQSPNGVSIAFWMNVMSQQDIYFRNLVYLEDKNSDFAGVVIISSNIVKGSMGSQAASTQASYSPQTWTHVTMTFNGTDTKLYLNGILANADSAPGIGSAYFSSLNIGHNVPNNKYLQGSIDELYIYNRALSPAEVTQLYTLK